ncbi:unnamed protein product [Scytosiphon promiscuus]
MPLVPAPRQWPRGPINELQNAAGDGLLERTEALLASGSVDVDMGDPQGWTPLIRAAANGHSHVVRALLAKGAEASVVADLGLTALHMSALNGHSSDLIRMLVRAGANIDAADEGGNTPLHLAATKGHAEAAAALIKAGATVNTRSWLDGPTPLFSAASRGHVDVVRHLLRAQADPLLSGATLSCGTRFYPLDVYGHPGVIRELLLRHGIEGCGGPSGGVTALCRAVQERHGDVMAVLIDAGVSDATGSALVVAAGGSNEAFVKYLLRERRRGVEGGTMAISETTYVNNARDTYGASPLHAAAAAAAAGSCSPRIVRTLLDAGADTAQALRVTDRMGRTKPRETPLALTTRSIRERKVEDKDATRQQLLGLEAVRRLLLREAAVHAVSWAWTSHAPCADGNTESRIRTAVAPTTRTAMVAVSRIVRRRAQKPDVLLAALSRWVGVYPGTE